MALGAAEAAGRLSSGWTTVLRLGLALGLLASAAWLAARDVDAVLVRPDHYVFGTSRGAQGAADLVARRDALIAGTTPQEIAA